MPKDTVDKLAKELVSNSSLTTEDKLAMLNHYLKTKQDGRKTNTQPDKRTEGSD